MPNTIDDYVYGQATLEVDDGGRPTSLQLQVTVAAVLAGAAKSDNMLSQAELGKVIGTLYREFGLSDHDGAHLIEVAEFLMRDPDAVERLLARLNLGFSIKQRQRVMSLAWRVLAADGAISAEEGAFAAVLRRELGLSLEQAAHAQAMAETIEREGLPAVGGVPTKESEE